MGRAIGLGIILATAHAFADPPPQATSDPNVGQPTVDPFYGAFVQHVAIDVPAFHDIEPRLALAYNSSAGNGLVGVGWQLVGISQIERIAPNKGAPHYDSTDTFMLDGMELIRCDGLSTPSPSCSTSTFVSGVTYYATKLESFKRIARDAATDTWTIWSKDGTRTTLSPMYRHAAGTFRWMVTSVADTSNRTATYTYSCDRGNGLSDCAAIDPRDVYPFTIAYGTAAKVVFTVEPRGEVSTFADGVALGTTSYRLAKITVFNANKLLRTYTLHYTASKSTDRSVLDSIAETGSDGTPAPVSRFSDPGMQTAAGPGATRTWRNATSTSDPKWMADFNGDGRTDVMFAVNHDEFHVALSNGHGFDGDTIWLPDPYPGAWSVFHSVGDFNGDGKIDLLDGTAVHLSDGHSFGPALSWITGGGMDCMAYGADARCEQLIADFNGDGKADYLTFDNGGGTYLVGLSTGSAFTPLATWLSGDWQCDSVGDFNGDGKADLFCIYVGIHYDANNQLIQRPGQFVALSTGYGFADPVLWGNVVQDTWGRRYLGDFNGDGKTDFLWTDLVRGTSTNVLYSGPWHVELSTGNGFLPDTVWLDAPSWTCEPKIADLNGDGKSDLTCNGQTAISTGAAFKPLAFWTAVIPEWQTYSPWGRAAYEYVGDFDGDGRVDFLDDVMPAGTSPGYWNVTPSSAPSTSGDLLTSVANGLGAVVTIAYAPSTTWPFDPSLGDAPVPAPVVQAVASVTIADGRGGSARTSYAYSNGKFDALSRRFLGFHRVTTTAPCIAGEAACPYSQTLFLQDYGSAAKPYQIDRFDGAGRLLERTVDEYLADDGRPPFTCLLGTQRHKVYDGAAVLETVKSFGYDAYGNRTDTTDFGDSSRSGDERITRTRFVANTAAYIVGLPAVTDTYDGATGKLVDESATYYDDAVTWNAAPSRGLVTTSLSCAAIDPATNACSSYVTKTRAYDSYGNPHVARDEVGAPTTFDYDATYHAYLVKTTNAANQVVTQTWDVLDGTGACGAPTSTTDANNQTATLRYDALCRRVLQTAPLGGFVKTAYTSFGDPNAQYIETATPSADGNGDQWVRTYVDGLGRTYRTARKGPTPIQIDTSYNARGKVATSTLPYYAGAATFTATTGYDALDRVTSVTHPDPNNAMVTARTSYTLASCPAGGTCSAMAVTDELGHVKRDLLDAHGQRVQHQEGAAATTYGFDAAGNNTSIADAAGNTWLYTFDPLHRTVTAIDPDLGPWSYTYRPTGALETQLDAKGQKTTLTYDVLGRKTALGAVGTVPRTVGWAYDEVRPGFFNIGQLTSATDATGTTTIDYDAARRRAVTTRTNTGSPALAIRTAFDAGGRPIGVTYPDGDMIAYGYDGAGRLSRIPGIVDSVAYNAADRITAIANSNGTLTQQTYSPSGEWLAGVATTFGTSSLQSIAYRRDAIGNITLETSGRCDESWAYAYDDLGRLTAGLDTGDLRQNVGFDYDAIDNITRHSQLGRYRYPPTYSAGLAAVAAPATHPHAVAQAGAASYQYDANGSMIAGAGRTITYDASNLVASVATPSSTSLFAYDADGERVSKQIGTAITYYVGDVEVANGVVTKYLRVGPQLVAQRTGTTTSWLHTDQLGSVRTTSTSTGAIGQTRKYTPYGASTTGVGYTGERQDETGLVYLHARYYDPALARYISADSSHPSLAGVGVNRYAYAGNNPIGRTDHTGREWTGDLFFCNYGWAPECETPEAHGFDDTPFYEWGTGGDNSPPDFPFLQPADDSPFYVWGDGLDDPQSLAEGMGYRGAEQDVTHDGGYAYTQERALGPVKDGVNALTVMKALQENPGKYFPFTVDGKITLGASLSLDNVRFHWDNGNWVQVIEVGPQSFTFEVRPGHFDAPGSTIRFTTYEKDGFVYLGHQGDALEAGFPGPTLIELGATLTWNLQAYNLSTAFWPELFDQVGAIR